MLAKTQRQPECPLVEDEIKTRYICTMGYYSAVRRRQNTVICYNMDDLENIMLRKILQVEKACGHRQQFGVTRGKAVGEGEGMA